jgi:hypothetical protein
MKEHAHRCFRFCLCVMALSLCNEAFAALITPLAQERSVRATAGAHAVGVSNSDTQSDAAIDFDPFHGEVGANASAGPFFEGYAAASSAASQASDIFGQSIFVSGNVSANVVAYSLDQEMISAEAEAHGSTNYNLTFWLSEPAEYVLTGHFTPISFLGNAPDVFISLERLGDAVIFQREGFFTSPINFGQTGTLSIGEYRLLMDGGADAFASAGIPMESDVSGEFSLELTLVPVPLPTAGWLFICGLLGLVGIARRRSVLLR